MNRSSTRARIFRVFLIVLAGALMTLTLARRVDLLGGASAPVMTDPVAGITRPTVFYFFTDYCPACRAMEPDVKSVLAACKDGPVEFRLVNPTKDEGRALGSAFRVQAVPTISFVDASGYERERRVGTTSRRTLLAAITRLTGSSCAVGPSS